MYLYTHIHEVFTESYQMSLALHAVTGNSCLFMSKCNYKFMSGVVNETIQFYSNHYKFTPWITS